MRSGRLIRILACSLPLMMAWFGGCGERDAQPGAAAAAATPVMGYAPDQGVLSQLRVAVRSGQPSNSGATASLPVEVPRMPGPHPYWSGVSATIDDAAARAGSEAATGGVALAGTVALAHELFAAHIQESGPRSLFLLEIPVRFDPQARFIRPLRGITVQLRLADHREWSLLTIPRLGFLGLRHGPLPLPGGPACFYFISDELGAAASMDPGSHQAVWSIRNADASPIALSNRLYAVILAPPGEHDLANAVVSATLHFSPGDEGSVTTAETRISISLGASGRSDAGQAPL